MFYSTKKTMALRCWLPNVHKLVLCISFCFSGCYSSKQLSQNNILLTTIKFKTFQDYFVKFKEFKKCKCDTATTLKLHLVSLFCSTVLPASNMWKSLKCSLLGLRPPRTTTRLSAMAVAVWNDRGSGCRPATTSSVSHFRVTRRWHNE